MVCSNRGGGIGAAFIDSIGEHIKRSLNVQPKFTNRFNGRTEDIQLNRYVLNRIMPSFSRSLPAGLKRDVRDFLICYKILRDVHKVPTYYFDDDARRIIDFFSRYFFCPELDTDDVKYYYYRNGLNSEFKPYVDSQIACFRKCVFTEFKIERAMKKGHDYYENAQQIDKIRINFLSRLFAVENDVVDLHHRAYKFRRSMALAKQREIL